MMAEAAERLIFSNFKFESFPNGMCRAEVELQRRGGETFKGVAQGSGSPVGSMQTAANASISALSEAGPPGPSFELLGVKATGAFDSTIVIVSIAAKTEDGSVRLVGSYVTEESPERGAAIAVLNATNRYLDKDLFVRA